MVIKPSISWFLINTNLYINLIDYFKALNLNFLSFQFVQFHCLLLQSCTSLFLFISMMYIFIFDYLKDVHLHFLFFQSCTSSFWLFQRSTSLCLLISKLYIIFIILEFISFFSTYFIRKCLLFMTSSQNWINWMSSEMADAGSISPSHPPQNFTLPGTYLSIRFW